MEWNGMELTLLSDSTLSLSVSSQVSSSQGFPKSSSPSPSTSSSGVPLVHGEGFQQVYHHNQAAPAELIVH